MTKQDDLRLKWIIAILLALLVLVAYWGAQQNGFINYDDPAYVTDNPHVKRGISWEGFVWAFTSTHVCNWHPLTWLSLMVDHGLYGLNAAGYHWTNVVLHLLSVLVLFFALSRMTRDVWCSGLAAALFGVHPLHVESVAWVAERKDVLSGLFWMLGLWGYARYVERPGAGRYFVLTLYFILGLLSKPMVVTFPFVLLLLDWWPLRRMQNLSPKSFGRLVFEKVPLFVLSALGSAVTYLVQKEGGAVASFEYLPLPGRIANAIVSYGDYLAKTLFPFRLSVFYPYAGSSRTGLLVAAVSILLAVTVAAVVCLRRFPYIVVGWFWYLGTLVPVIGLVQVGSQAMADRYTYLPLIGIFVMMAWGLQDLLRVRPRLKLLTAVVTGVILVLLVLMTQTQVGYWKESITLFTQAIQNTRANDQAHYTLAMAMAEKNDFMGAEKHYREALGIRPAFPEANAGLGHILMTRGDYAGAERRLEAALQKKPEYVPALKNMADLRMRQQRVDEALPLYLEALLYERNDHELFNNHAVALFCKGQEEDALMNIREALRLKPDYRDALNNLHKILEHRAGR